MIIETGVARVGSIVFWSGRACFNLLANGTVLGVDIDIRPTTGRRLRSISLRKGLPSSKGRAPVHRRWRRHEGQLAHVERVMVVLDSDHTYEHVLAELEAYGPLVTPGQYLIVFDTIVEHIPPQAP